MKQDLLILFTAAMMGCLGCDNNKQTTAPVPVEQKTAEVINDPSKDTAAIRLVVADFYNWYNKSSEEVQRYHLYSSINKKESPHYKINWEEVEKYQAYIRKSVPWLGDEFLKNQKLFLQQCDSAFRVDVEDDIPYGFDYDWYTNSQEGPEYLLDAMYRGLSSWDIMVNGDAATVKLTGFNDHRGKQERITYLSLAMKKEKGNWKIAKIGMD
ncbi:MAG: hypothetical protein H7Y01_13140 [Ferruginibacter sp.]|nr:hypothetical protein [Chitinophagaceae bacterium]